MSFPMSFPKISYAQNICGEHPFFPMPDGCMKCAFYAYKKEHAADKLMSGTSDLATSLYPKPPSMLCRNGTYENPFQTSTRYAAPAVNMTYLNSFKPRIISTTFFTKDRPAPVTIISKNDNYPERFALSPVGPLRRITISPERGDYPERFALSLSPGEEHNSEEDADYESDPDMPAAPAIIVEMKTASTKPLKKPSPQPKRRSTRLSRITQKEYDDNSDSEAIEFEPNLIFVDKQTGERFYKDDTIKVDIEESHEEESESATSDDDEACAICKGLDSRKRNEILFCDGCNLPVHKKCYGVAVVPGGDWFCRDCKPQEKKDKQKPAESAKPTATQKTQSAKRKRDPQDDDEAEQQKDRSFKRTRKASSVVISDDKEEQKPSRRVTKRKRNSQGDEAEEEITPPSKRKRSVIVIDDDSDEEQKPSRGVTNRKRGRGRNWRRIKAQV